MQRRGITNYELKSYEGLAHTLCQSELQDVSSFLNRLLPNNELYITKPKEQSVVCLLVENGKQHIMRDVIQDGSFVLCSKCNNLVACDRFTAHNKFWCDFAESNEDEDNSDSS